MSSQEVIELLKCLEAGSKEFGFTSMEQQAFTQAIHDLKEYDEMKELLEKVSKKSKEMLTICKKENFVFNNLDDRWQKLAFTFYSEIVQLSDDAITYLKGEK